MSPRKTTPAPDRVRERSIGLFNFLKSFAALRTKVTRRVDDYEEVIWLDDLPRVAGFFCAAQSPSDRDSELWVQLRRPRAPKPPPPLDGNLNAWVEYESLFDIAGPGPTLRSAIPDDDDPGEWLLASDQPELEDALARYVRDYWEQWAADNRVALAAQQVYNAFFSIHTKQQRLGEAFEVVLGLGLLTWRTGSGQDIARHLLTAQTDVQFEAVNGMITVRAAADGAKVSLEEDMLDVEDTPDVEEREVVESLLLDVGDDIFVDPNIPAALSAWVNSVSPDGVFDPAGVKPGATGLSPHVAFAPALILRRRGDRSIIRAMQEILTQLEAGEPIPDGVVRFVEIQDDPTGAVDGESEDGLPAEQDGRLYFPLPSNEEQMDIVRRLQGRQGVLVQGPPGTGKSHTIANIVCHLLAQGQRVLITSHAARALEVLKDKIPVEVQALAVMVLGNDSKAQERLQSSVQGINDRYARWDPQKSARRQQILADQLDDRVGDEAKLMAELRALRERDTFRHPPKFGSYSGTEQEIAARVAAEEGEYRWIGAVADSDSEPPLTDAEAVELLQSLRRVPPSRDAELALGLPAANDLPSPAGFAARVQEEHAAAQVATEPPATPSDPLLKALTEASTDQVDAYAKALVELRDLSVRLETNAEPWVRESLTQVLSGREGRWQQLKQSTDSVVAELEQHLPWLPGAEPTALAGRAAPTVEADARSLVARLAEGKGLGFGPLRPAVVKRTRYIRESIIDGQRCDSPAALQKLLSWIAVATGLGKLGDLWSSLTTVSTSTPAVQLADYADLARKLGEVLAISAAVKSASAASAAIPGIRPPVWHLTTDIESHLAAIEACRRRESHLAIKGSIDRVAKALSSGKATSHPVAAALQTAVSRRNQKAYGAAYQTFTKLLEDQGLKGRREELLLKVTPVLPHLPEELEVDHDAEAWTLRMVNFVAAFNWGRADQWLKERFDPLLSRRLLSQIDEKRDESARITRELAAEKAWASCLSQLTAQQRASLVAWQLEIRKIGKGTGKHAPRHRRRARAYMNDCRTAIPAWIMPIYRVAETMEIRPETFDTVIVDEASQSGPEALFLQYLAKKVIVVGDDQQISPSNVGIDRNQVDLLAQRYLKDVPLGGTFASDSSLFDHAAIRYPDKLALREHFRCMPEIIQFSNNLCYADRPLIPLRQFDASRLSPVVLTRHVATGRLEDTQNVNKPEAEAIVAQIEACCQDPRYAGKSFGVISLIGDRQAQFIERILTQRIGAVEMETRRIVCGDAYAFQGDERDVMFLSLVQAPREGRPLASLTTDDAKRRFNVAASRARDQAWLFHTATLNDLNRSGLPSKLLDYYLSPAVEPAGAEASQVDSVRSRAADPRRSDTDPPPPFESWFEVDVFLRVVDRGFRVIPQYELASYRIDLVVEGVNGRLAVECDGDFWHGDDQFEADAGRQRLLERCGLRFFRVRGTAFYRDPDAALQPLWDELSRLRIFASAAEADAAPDVGLEALEQSEDTYLAEMEVGVEAVDEVDRSATQAVAVEPAAHADLTIAPPTAARSGPPTDHLDDYVVYQPISHLPDPRYTQARQLVAGLVAIVETEGPIVCERLFQTYVKSAGSSRVSSVMRDQLFAGLRDAQRQGLLEGRSELPGDQHPISQVVRLGGGPPVRLRSRGDRTFFEIPPSEIAALMALIAKATPDQSREVLFRSVLDLLDLRRMTTGVERRLIAIQDAYSLRDPSLPRQAEPAVEQINTNASEREVPPPMVTDLPGHAITPNGLERLEQEHDQLTNVTIPELIEHRRANDAAGMGLEPARKRLADLGKRIAEAAVVAPPTIGEFVQFGTIVTVELSDGQQQFEIVGALEADLSQGRLNVTSELAHAVYGHKVGDLVTVNAPAGRYDARIVSISIPEVNWVADP